MKSLSTNQRLEFVAELRHLGLEPDYIARITGTTIGSVRRWFTGKATPCSPVIERFREARRLEKGFLSKIAEQKKPSSQQSLPFPESISRRDYFAGQAIIALIGFSDSAICAKAVRYADQLIQELDKPTPSSHA